MAWSDSKYPRARRLPADWQTRRLKVLRRDRHECQLRGPRCTGNATEVDHRSRGDNHELGNLQAACKNCHSAKTAQEAGHASGAARRARAASRYRPEEQHPGLLK